MERLFTWYIIAILALGAIKTLGFWGVAKIKSTGRGPIAAEDIITGYNKNKIVVANRSKDIELNYSYLRDNFRTLLQCKQLSRKDLLAIRKYLRQNVHQYEKKKFKNDAHAIYTMLKADDLKMKHIDTIQKFLNNKEV